MSAQAAAAAGGIGMKILGGLMQRRDAQENADKQAAAQNAVLMKFLDKQRALGSESRGYFDTNMADYAPGAQDALLAAVQGQRTAAITGNQTAPTDGGDVAISRSAPKVVRGEIAKRMLASFNESTDRAKAMGKLGGYGDQWQNNGMTLQDTSRRIGTVNNFSNAESSLLASEQALRGFGATKAPSIWGPILSAGGDMLTMGAGGGMFGGAPAAGGVLPGGSPLGSPRYATPTQRA